MILKYSDLMAEAKLSLDEEEESAGLELLGRVMALGRSNGYISMDDG